MIAAVSLWHNPSIFAQVKTGSFIELDNEGGGCGDMPFVPLEKVISSNLAKMGPDKDAEEGMIFEAVTPKFLQDMGVNASKLQVHIHSLASFDAEEGNYAKNYHPAFKTGPYVNGIYGHFANINIEQNETAFFIAHVYDAETKKDLSLPKAAITFFDLDTGKDNIKSVEHVKVAGFKDYYVTNETEINVTTEGDFTVFTATKEGTGEDNPKTPTELTVQQKNRAVTLEFEDLTEFKFAVGVTPGKTGRVFSFVFRPSLLCAKTKIGSDLFPATGADAPLVPVEGGAQTQFPSLMLMFGLLSAAVLSFM